jgi:phosphate transport system protein
MVAEHTVKAFDDDITRLRGLVAEMGGLAELSIAEAMDALVSATRKWPPASSPATAGSTLSKAQVDRLSVRVLALRAPMADDLREVIAALKIAGVIERSAIMPRTSPSGSVTSKGASGSNRSLFCRS